MKILTNKEFSKLREDNPNVNYCVLQTDRSFTQVNPFVYQHGYINNFSKEYLYMVLTREEIEQIICKCGDEMKYQKDFRDAMMKCNLVLE